MYQHLYFYTTNEARDSPRPGDIAACGFRWTGPRRIPLDECEKCPACLAIQRAGLTPNINRPDGSHTYHA